MPTCYTPSDRAWSDAITRSLRAANDEPDPGTFATGAMCGTCGFECDPGDTVDAANAAHLAFDPAHDASWHVE